MLNCNMNGFVHKSTSKNAFYGLNKGKLSKQLLKQILDYSKTMSKKKKQKINSICLFKSQKCSVEKVDRYHSKIRCLFCALSTQLYLLRRKKTLKSNDGSPRPKNAQNFSKCSFSPESGEWRIHLIIDFSEQIQLLFAEMNIIFPCCIDFKLIK